jgi:hypothetical protein
MVVTKTVVTNAGQDKQTMTCGATCGYLFVNFDERAAWHNGFPALTTRDCRGFFDGSAAKV